MTFSPATLHTFLPPANSYQRIFLGLSGGLDSMVLLHALAALELTVPVIALHVNHQISPYSNQWQAQCEASCRALNVPFLAERVAVKVSGRGLEDAARAARYAVFEQHLQAGDVLLTAHHADDQAETLLLRLLRGAGPRGLAAMASARPLGLGTLCRPLLTVARAALQTYAEAQQLVWVDDESNADIHYDRNFLRHQIMPLLAQRWPQVNQRFQQSAKLCGDADQLLGELAAEDLSRSERCAERLGESLCLVFLVSLSLARRHNLLRHWLQLQGCTVPEQSHLLQVEQQLIAGRQDAEAAVTWGGMTLHRYRNRLYAVPVVEGGVEGGAGSDNQTTDFLGGSVTLGGQDKRCVLIGGGSLSFEYCESVPDNRYLRADLTSLQLTRRQGGERCQPAGRTHSQTLKRLLQEYALEPWWRPQLPLIFCNDHLVAVGDLWICQEFNAAPGQAGYRLHWQPGHR